MPYFQSVLLTVYRSRCSDKSRGLAEETYFNFQDGKDLSSLDWLWGPLVSNLMNNGGSFPIL
jgi:hypothetical protein